MFLEVSLSRSRGFLAAFDLNRTAVIVCPSESCGVEGFGSGLRPQSMAFGLNQVVTIKILPRGVDTFKIFKLSLKS